MKNIAILSAIFITLLLFITSDVYSASLQGRLDKFGPLGIVPAPFVSVTLFSEASKQNIKTVISGSDGMYYFDNIEPGYYILKVWVMGFMNESLNYKELVLNQKSTITEPKVIHSIQFDIPEKGKLIPAKQYLRVRGTHYTLPDDAFLWVLFSDSSNYFYFSDDHPIVVKKDGSWKTSDSIQFDEHETKINIVIVTQEGNKKFQKMSKFKLEDRILALPKDSFVIASQDIRVIG